MKELRQRIERGEPRPRMSQDRILESGVRDLPAEFLV